MDVRRYWDGSVPWVTPKDMKRPSLGDSSIRVTEDAIRETSLNLIPAPAVLMVVRGMILARKVPVAWTTAPVTVNQDMKALLPGPGLDARFLAAFLSAAKDAFVPLIDEAGHGTRRLPTERWRDLLIVLPPQDEQAKIVRSLDSATGSVERAVVTTTKDISLMREYRSRLIADVVTGTLDVREAAARLPEGLEEPDEGDEVDTEADVEESSDAGDAVAAEAEA
jgi:type I restriction enzyme S subunit